MSRDIAFVTGKKVSLYFCPARIHPPRQRTATDARRYSRIRCATDEITERSFIANTAGISTEIERKGTRVQRPHL